MTDAWIAHHSRDLIVVCRSRLAMVCAMKAGRPLPNGA
jgi:hypothetical protein